MIELNLTANDTQERKVLAYLQENASDVLANKINNGTPFEKDGHPLTNKKTLSGFMKYACDEAQKLAEKGARSACVDDEIVYGWAIHYFEIVSKALCIPLTERNISLYQPQRKQRKSPSISPLLRQNKNLQNHRISS